jgi:hypothetical protein
VKPSSPVNVLKKCAKTVKVPGMKASPVIKQSIRSLVTILKHLSLSVAHHAKRGLKRMGDAITCVVYSVQLSFVGFVCENTTVTITNGGILWAALTTYTRKCMKGIVGEWFGPVCEGV